MPHHLARARRRRRWIGLLTLALAAVLVATGIWWIATLPQPSEPAGATTTEGPHSPAAATPGPQTADAATTAAGGPVLPTQAPTSAVPTSAAAVDPVTGRVSTLEGLVPDYVLPPIENGLAPVLTKIPTAQKVVFLTIDDGAVKRDSDLALLEQHGFKASLFLAHNFIAAEPQFYRKYLQAGHLVENHTMTHNLGFIKLSYEAQKAEICGMADFEEQQFGRRPVFFRPPGGPYTQATRAAVAACGLKAIVDWEAKANASGMDYQVGASLRPGDIVLMHFRPEFPADLAAFVAAQEAAGLKVVLLEDYLGMK